MALTDYVVLAADGTPVRAGRCREQDFAKQAQTGETVRKPTAAHLRALQQRRAAQLARVEGYRVAAAKAAPVRVLAEALRAKGVEITQADLDAAAARLRASG